MMEQDDKEILKEEENIVEEANANVETESNEETTEETKGDVKPLEKNEMFRIIEGMLFVSNESVPIKGIATALNLTIAECKEVMDELMKIYEEDEARGIKIVKFNDKFQLVTKQNIFGYLTKANSELEKPRISPSMLETLAIIAYKQPITKMEIESIRGVKSDYIVNKLVEYELIKEVGRAEKIGRPLLFGTSDKFLIYFGLEALDNLPQVAESKQITNDNIDEELVRLKHVSETDPSEDITLAIEAAEALKEEWKTNPPKTAEELEAEKLADAMNENAEEENGEAKVENTEETNIIEMPVKENENKEEAEEKAEEVNETESKEDDDDDDFHIDWDSYTEEDDEDDDDDDDWDDYDEEDEDE